MAPRNSGVKIGDVRPMSGGGATPPPPQDDRFNIPGPDRESLGNPIQNFWDNVLDTVTGGGAGAFAPGGPGFVPPQTFSPETSAGGTQALQELSAAEKLAQMQAFQQSGRAQQDVIYGNRPETQQMPSFDEYLASLGLLGGGGGAVRPDYSAYRAALTDQAQQLNAQIQAMYNQLAGQAGENVGRIQDIYGGATAGIEAGYGSAAENIAQAYESAQQQAAEQMARLGIEEAAQQVLPSQALSQAEAVAGLEAGRAGGLSAAERYGASGAQFGSEMAQVAQQQGTEMNAAILASLQNRLAESLAAEQAGVSGGGGGGMSVSDMLRLQDAYRQDVLGELPIEEQRRALEMAMGQEQAAQEAQATLRYRAAQIAIDLAPRDASPEEMQQAYDLALTMLGG